VNSLAIQNLIPVRWLLSKKGFTWTTRICAF